MYFYLYKIKNVINEKEYIGIHKSNSLCDPYYGSGTAIKKAIKKYGRENFHKEILMLASDWEELKDLEKIAVNPDYVKRRDTYNLREGGNGSYGLKRDNNPFYGKTHTDFTKKIMSQKAKINNCGVNNPFYGRKHSEESKKSISKTKKGVPQDQNRKGFWVTPYGKFRTWREASEKTKLSGSTIKRRCLLDSNKKVGYNYQIPLEFQGEKTWKDRGWYFEEFGGE